MSKGNQRVLPSPSLARTSKSRMTKEWDFLLPTPQSLFTARKEEVMSFTVLFLRPTRAGKKEMELGPKLRFL